LSSTLALLVLAGMQGRIRLVDWGCRCGHADSSLLPDILDCRECCAHLTTDERFRHAPIVGNGVAQLGNAGTPAVMRLPTGRIVESLA